MVDSSEIDLSKIDKLLDKIQKDIKKYHADEDYDESEKYISHIQKTTELYSLTLQEIIGSLEMSGLNQYSAVTKKLFKGMQYQVMSILKFGLYHFRRQHLLFYQEQLRQEQLNLRNQQESTLALITVDPDTQDTIQSENKLKKANPNHLHSYENIEGKSAPSGFYSGNGNKQTTPRANQSSSGFSKGNKTWNTLGLNLQAQSLSNFRVAYGTQFNNKLNGEHSQDMILMTTNRNTLEDNNMKESLNNLLTNEDDEEEMKEFFYEHERIQQEISEVLKGKQLVNKLLPGNKVSNNLKEILDDLELTQKNVTLMTQQRRSNRNSDDEMSEPEFSEMGERIKKAFNQAKDKATQNMEELLKLKNAPVTAPKKNTKGKVVKGKGKPVSQITMKDAETMIWDDLMKPKIETKRGSFEGDHEILEFKKQISELKAKIAQMEKEKSDKGDKYTKLVNDYTQCAQEKRDAWVKIKQLEIEIAELQEILKIAKINEEELKATVTKIQENSIKAASIKSKQEIHNETHTVRDEHKENIKYSPAETSVINHPVLELDNSRSNLEDLGSLDHIPASIQNSNVNSHANENTIKDKVIPTGNLERAQEGFSPQVQIKNLSSIYKSNGNNSIYQNASQLSHQNRILGDETARSEALSNLNQVFSKRVEENEKLIETDKNIIKLEPTSLNQSKEEVKVVENYADNQPETSKQQQNDLLHKEETPRNNESKNKKEKILPNDILTEQESEKEIKKGTKTSLAEKTQANTGKSPATTNENLNKKKIAPSKPQIETTNNNSVERQAKNVQNETQKHRRVEERSPEVQRQERPDPAIKQEKETKPKLERNNMKETSKDGSKTQRFRERNEEAKTKEHSNIIEKSPEIPKHGKDIKPKITNKKEENKEQGQSPISPKAAKIAQTNERNQEPKAKDFRSKERSPEVSRHEKEGKPKLEMSNIKTDKIEKANLTPRAAKLRYPQRDNKAEETKEKEPRQRDRSSEIQRPEKETKMKINTSSSKTILPMISPSGSKTNTPYNRIEEKPKEEVVLITQPKINNPFPSNSKENSQKQLNQGSEKKVDSISVIEEISVKMPQKPQEIIVGRVEEIITGGREKPLADFKTKAPILHVNSNRDQATIDREQSPRKRRMLLELSEGNKIFFHSNLVSPGPKSLKGLNPVLFKTPQSKREFIGREGWKETGTASAGYLFSNEPLSSKNHLQSFSATERLPQLNRDKKVGKSLQILTFKDEKEPRYDQNISADVPFMTIKRKIINESYLRSVGILPDNKRTWQELIDNKRKRAPREGAIRKGRAKFSLTIAANFYGYEDGFYSDSSGNRFLKTSPRGGRSDFVIESLSVHRVPFGGYSSGYNSDNDASNEARYKHIPHKMTIDECIRLEILREHEEPARTSEERQLRVMYRSMLAKAKQYPKLITYIQRIVQIDPDVVLSGDHPVVEFEAFAAFVKKYTEIHAKCGENCSHLMKFYAKIGYHVFWNNRSPLTIKRTEIGHTPSMIKTSPKFPSIIKKKKELGKDNV